jgi:hypothetical protein
LPAGAVGGAVTFKRTAPKKEKEEEKKKKKKKRRMQWQPAYIHVILKCP